MSIKRRIVVAGLDTSVRSIVNECLPSDHFDIAEFAENTSVASTAHVDLVIFSAPKDLEQTQALCATLRSHVSQSAPLLCCAGRYVYWHLRVRVDSVSQNSLQLESSGTVRRSASRPSPPWF